MRVAHKVNVQIGTDASFSEKLFYPEDINAQINLDDFTNDQAGTIGLAALGTAALHFGQVVDCRGGYIKVSAACTVSINGGAAITLTPGSSGSPAKLFIEAALTSLSITNTSSTTALTGFYVVWGDPA